MESLNKSKKIGIVVAMDEEIKPFFSFIKSLVNTPQVEDETRYTHILGLKKVHRFSYMGYDMVMVRSGIGRTNAANATALLLREGVRAIINFGTCGCTYENHPWEGKKVEIGDVMLPKYILDGDFDLSALGVMTKDPCGVYSREQLEDLKDPSNMICYTVSHFSTTPLADHPYLVDMEAYAIEAMCREFQIPAFFIKVVSDKANEHAVGFFTEFVSHVIVKASNQILRRIGDILEYMNLDTHVSTFVPTGEVVDFHTKENSDATA